MRDFELEHIGIQTYHPESQGRIERFHRSTREALDGADLENLSKAREIIGRWVTHYNEQRLHAALDYLPICRRPSTYAGDPEAPLTERRRKLEAARKQRRDVNRTRFRVAA